METLPSECILKVLSLLPGGLSHKFNRLSKKYGEIVNSNLKKLRRVERTVTIARADNSYHCQLRIEESLSPLIRTIYVISPQKCRCKECETGGEVYLHFKSGKIFDYLKVGTITEFLPTFFKRVNIPMLSIFSGMDWDMCRFYEFFLESAAELNCPIESFGMQPKDYFDLLKNLPLSLEVSKKLHVDVLWEMLRQGSIHQLLKDYTRYRFEVEFQTKGRWIYKAIAHSIALWLDLKPSVNFTFSWCFKYTKLDTAYLKCFPNLQPQIDPAVLASHTLFELNDYDTLPNNVDITKKTDAEVMRFHLRKNEAEGSVVVSTQFIRPIVNKISAMSHYEREMQRIHCNV